MKSIKEIKKNAKMSLKGRHGICLLGEVICSAAETVAGVIPFGNTIVGGALEVGKMEIYTKACRQEKPQFKDLFQGFAENFGENFLLGLLRNVFLFLWSMLFLVPGIVKSFSYAMSTYLITRNKELSAMEALKESQSRMKGHKFDLFRLNLSFFGWVLLTVITLGIAGIYTIPYMHAAHVEFFNSLCEE